MTNHQDYLRHEPASAESLIREYLGAVTVGDELNQRLLYKYHTDVEYHATIDVAVKRELLLRSAIADLQRSAGWVVELGQLALPSVDNPVDFVGFDVLEQHHG